MSSETFKKIYREAFSKVIKEYQRLLLSYQNSSDDAEKEKLKDQIELCEERIKALQNIILYPAYIRYSNMQEDEYLELRDKKINECNRNIEELTGEYDKLVKIIQDKIAEMKKLMVAYLASSDEREKRKCVDKADILNGEIGAFESKTGLVKDEIDKKTNERDKYLNKNHIDFKDEVLNSVEVAYMENARNLAAKPKSTLTEKVLRKIIRDDKKLEVFIELSKKYEEVKSKKHTVSEDVDFDAPGLGGLRTELYNTIPEFDSSSTSLNSENYDGYNNLVSSYSENYNTKKKALPDVSLDTLMKLFEHGNNFKESEFDTNVDMSFIEANSKMITPNYITELKEYIGWIEANKNRKIKTSSFKEGIDMAEKEIAKLQSVIYREISLGYFDKFKDFERIIGSSDITGIFLEMVNTSTQHNISVDKPDGYMTSYHKAMTLMNVINKKASLTDSALQSITTRMADTKKSIDDGNKVIEDELSALSTKASEHFGDKFVKAGISLDGGIEAVKKQVADDSVRDVMKTAKKEELNKKANENPDLTIEELIAFKKVIMSPKEEASELGKSRAV